MVSFEECEFLKKTNHILAKIQERHCLDMPLHPGLFHPLSGAADIVSTVVLHTSNPSINLVTLISLEVNRGHTSPPVFNSKKNLFKIWHFAKQNLSLLLELISDEQMCIWPKLI